MAVLPDCPGLKVEVVVDRESLKEYDDNEGQQPEGSRSKSITKYIEAVSGAQFAIRSTFAKSFSKKYDVEISISVDGHEIDREHFERKFLSLYTFENSVCTRWINGQEMRSTLQFSELAQGKSI